MILSIDIETFSSIDLLKCGAYRYTQAPDFDILLFGYAFDDQPVRVIDLACGELLPADVINALTDPAIIKTAFNANFERTCIARRFRVPMPPEQWRCSSVHALTLGLPGSLAEVAKTLNLNDQKDAAGKALIKYFCCPCSPTKTNGGRLRNLPEHDAEKWAAFKRYCAQDVEVERELRTKLDKYPILEKEHKLWALDQHINDRGVKVERDLVEAAIDCDTQNQERLISEAVKLTGLDNPNSVAQLKGWFLEAEGLEIESLAKGVIPELICKVTGDVSRRVLELRRELAKTSVKKYQAMQRSIAAADDRIRGMLQFYGANRTGRWAGRLVQIHNLPQNKIADIDVARELLLDRNFDGLDLLFESTPVVLSQLIRTAFIPEPGHTFLVADFSAIEARVLAWLAGEQWVLEVFAGDGKIYEACAARMFGVPVDRIKKGSPEYSLRQKGKVATLACGYGGGKGALINMGATNMGVPEESLQELIDAWRAANPKIVSFWRKVERAAVDAVKGGSRVVVPIEGLDGYNGIEFFSRSGFLFVRLPSGRTLAYARPRIEPDPVYGKDGLTYEGYEQGRWSRSRTYGGKIAENLTQAVARDCLAESMLTLDAAGYKIAFHVHDEVIAEMPDGCSVEEMCAAMSTPIAWAPGLPLAADGFETKYYMKEG